MTELKSVFRILAKEGLLGVPEVQDAVTKHLEQVPGRKINAIALFRTLAEKGHFNADRVKELIAALETEAELPRPQGLLFGQAAVQQGWVRPDQVHECLRAQADLASKGVEPVPRLGEMLVQKGYLTPAQVEAILDLLKHPQEFHPSERVGRYVKIERLGEGAMGEVWKAWDMDLNRWVALKFLKAQNAEERLRFRREAQMAANLVHPNIAAVYEARENAISMQFVDGQTLAAFPHNDIRVLIEIIRQVAAALQHAHEQGILHRDIKPGNIMVIGSRGSTTLRRRLGEPSRPKNFVHAFVMDFGMAKAMNVDASLSGSGWIVGTPSYMSPEQAKGKSRLAPTSDVYSLGATLYELLTETPPFRDTNVYELLKKVIEEEPKPIRKIRPDINTDLETIVMRCLEKDPSRRYQTTQELAEELERWLQGESILASPPSTVYRIRRFVQRRRTLILVTAATQLLALVIAVGGWRIGEIRAFDRIKSVAQAYYGASRWKEARGACEQALHMRFDGRLIAIAEECRRRIETEERKTQEVKNYRQLQERLKLIRGTFQEATSFFYLKDVGIQEKFKKMDPVLSELEELVQDSAYGTFAEVWTLLGIGWYHGGDHAKAQEALLKAEALAPEDGETHHHLARIHRERTLEAREPAVALQELTKARDHLNRSSQAEEIDRHGLAACQALVEERSEEAIRLCEEGVQRFGQKPGTELYWDIRGRVKPHERVACLTRAIEIRPNDARIYLRRGEARKSAGDLLGAQVDYEKSLELSPPRWSQRGEVENLLEEIRQPAGGQDRD